MVETLVAFGMLGSLPARQHGDKAVGDADRVDHLMLGITGMYVAALDGDLGGGGVEVFILELADCAAIHSVGEIAAESLDVELMGTQADLLVGVEADADLAMLDLGIALEISHSGDDLGDAGLIVGAKECCAVGDNQVIAQIIDQLGEILGIESDALSLVEHDGLTIIILDDAGIDMAARHVGARIHVGDKAYHRHGTIHVGWQCGKEITILIESDIAEAHAKQNGFQVFGKFHLTRRGGCHIGQLIALGVELDKI